MNTGTFLRWVEKKKKVFAIFTPTVLVLAAIVTYQVKLHHAKEAYARRDFDQAVKLFQDLSEKTLSTFVLFFDITNINKALDAANNMSKVQHSWSTRTPIDIEQELGRKMDRANEAYPYGVIHDTVK